MQERRRIRNRISHSVLCCVLVCISFVSIPATYAQQAEQVTLKQESLSYVPKGYYIDKVIDDRKQQDVIGTAKKNTPIIIKDGARAALTQFIAKNMKPGKDKTPLTLHITKFNTRIRQSGRTWMTESELLFTFYFGDMRIASQGNNGKAQSGEYTVKYAEDFFSRSVNSVFQAFDKWWTENKSQVPLSKAITINVSVARTCNQEKTIVYTPGRPLQIADFKAPSVPKKLRAVLPPDAAACTSSSIEKSMTMEVNESRHTLDVVLTPAFYTHESWFKPDVTNKQVLAHEQTHFDITALKTCELAQAIKALSLTIDNYQEKLSEIFNRYVQDWSEQEDQYDEETGHGTIDDKQLNWQHKISEKLKQQGCY